MKKEKKGLIFGRPILRIPTLAIHLDRTANDGVNEIKNEWINQRN